MTCTNTSVTGTGDSTVQMEDGSIKSMAELQLGDKVGAFIIVYALTAWCMHNHLQQY